MFDGFTLEMVDVADDVRLRVRIRGHGPAVVLLHGHPRTHTTWHRVAPQLAAAGYTVVCPDLRGYGRSTAPRPEPDHAQASKRAMASDVVALMDHLSTSTVPDCCTRGRADAHCCGVVRSAIMGCVDDQPRPYDRYFAPDASIRRAPRAGYRGLVAEVSYKGRAVGLVYLSGMTPPSETVELWTADAVATANLFLTEWEAIARTINQAQRDEWGPSRLRGN